MSGATFLDQGDEHGAPSAQDAAFAILDRMVAVPSGAGERT